MRRYNPAGKKDETTDSQVAAYFADLQREFGPYLVSPKETRRLVDRDMGDVTLTDLLHKARRDRP